MTWFKFGCVACFLGTGIAIFAGEGQPPAPGGGATEAALMRAKLASSDKIMEGLMARDFKLIQDGAQELAKICEATQWHAEEDQVYAHYRSELTRSARKLAALARDEDQDGALYTYMHSITTCIGCHDYCRDVLHVATEEPKLQVIPSYETNRARPSVGARR